MDSLMDYISQRQAKQGKAQGSRAPGLLLPAEGINNISYHIVMFIPLLVEDVHRTSADFDVARMRQGTCLLECRREQWTFYQYQKF